MIRYSPTLLAAAAALLPTLAAAQSGTAGAGVSFETYSFSDAEAARVESVTLFTVPLAARVSLSRWVQVQVASAYARAELQRANGTSASIAGLTDTEVRVTVPLGRDRVTLSGVAVLATGEATVDSAQIDVAGIIAADLLPFRITHWGSGGGFGGSAALAVPFTGGAFGVSASYLAAGEFQPLADGDASYRPGNQLAVQLAVDRSVGRAGKVALKLGLQRYGDDELGGTNLYRSGDRFQAMGSYAFAAGPRAGGILYAGLLHRAEGTALAATEVAPSQDLILAGGGLRLPRGALTLPPTVDVRVFRSADGIGQGYTTGIGSSVEWAAGVTTVTATARARFGSVIAYEDAETGFTGFEAGLGLRFGGRRQ